MDYALLHDKITNFNDFNEALIEAGMVWAGLFLIKSMVYILVKYKKIGWSVLTALPVSLISLFAFVFYNFTDLAKPPSIELGFFVFLFGFILLDFVLLSIFKWKSTIAKALLAATVSNLVIFIILLIGGIVYVANFVPMIPNTEEY